MSEKQWKLAWLAIGAVAAFLGIGVWILKPSFLFPTPIRPLQFSVAEKVDIPAQHFGAQRVVAADLDGDGVQELVGINLPTAYVLRKSPQGWEKAWSGMVVPPEEATRWYSHGELRTMSAGRFLSEERDDLAVSIADVGGEMAGRFFVLQWDPQAGRLTTALSVSLPQGTAPFGVNFDTGFAVRKASDGLFLYGAAASTPDQLEFQPVKWRVEKDRLVEVARGPAQYPGTTYANNARLGWIGGRRVLSLTYGLTCAACRGMRLGGQALFDAETLEVVSLQQDIAGFLVGGSPDVDSKLLVRGPAPVKIYGWGAKGWTLETEIPVSIQEILDSALTASPAGRVERLAVRTADTVEVWDLNGKLIGKTSLPGTWPYQGTLSFIGEDLAIGEHLAVADRNGARILAVPDAGGDNLKPVWQGLDFRGLRLAGALDLDGDGIPETVSHRGDIFRQGTDGRYHFERTNPQLGTAFSSGWQPVHFTNGIRLLVKREEKHLAVGQWQENGVTEIGRIDMGELLGSWDIDGDGVPDLIVVQGVEGAGAGTARVSVIGGRDMKTVASAQLVVPVPESPFSQEMMRSFRAVPVPVGKNHMVLFLNVPTDADRRRTYRADWRLGQSPAVQEVTPAVVLPGIFATGGPVQVGALGSNQWIVVGRKYNSAATALSIMQVDRKGQPVVQELSLSEHGLSVIESFDLVDVNRDGRAELLVNSSGQIYIFTVR